MKFFMDSSKFVQGRQLAANASGCGSRRSQKGSLAQVPLPILFRTLPRPSLRCVFVHRNGDASPAAPLFHPRRMARPYKSLFLRQEESRLNPRLFYLCITCFSLEDRNIIKTSCETIRLHTVFKNFSFPY